MRRQAAPDPEKCPSYVISALEQRVPNRHQREFQTEVFLMNFRPLHDRVLVRRLEQEERTAGGVIIPDTAKEKPMEGEVIAVGPGSRDEQGQIHPLDVKVGDRVLFGKWAGTDVKIDNEELVILKESDIFGVFAAAAAQKRAA